MLQSDKTATDDAGHSHGMAGRPSPAELSRSLQMHSAAVADIKRRRDARARALEEYRQEIRQLEKKRMERQARQTGRFICEAGGFW